MPLEAQAPETQGAMHELTRDPASRAKFLKMMGGAGAAGAFSIFLAACGDDDNKTAATTGGTTTAPTTTSNGSADGDIKILNYALTLEYVEDDFYRDVVESGLFKGDQQDLLKRFGGHEHEHVEALTAAVKKFGGTPATKPQTKFPLDSASSVVKLAATVENLGAAAYLGQAASIQNKEALAAALAIHTVEARHAAVLNTLLGKSGTPTGAFAKPASMEEVLPQVKPFLVA